MTLEEIRELIQVVRETGVAELELQRGEDRVKIRLTPEGRQQEIVIPYAAPQTAHAHAPVHLPAPAVTPSSAAAPPDQNAEILSDPALVYVKAPIVGTYYDAPSPDSSPFVNEGDTVQPGQVLCIIESMKLMNEIEAEVAGTIVKKFAENAHPVEYGETLFAVKPA